MTRQLLVIDGIDGSGKTRFAARVEQACRRHGLAPRLLRVDDYRCRIEWDRVADEAGAYYDDYYDFAALDAGLRAFAAGVAEIVVPTWDPISERVTGHHRVGFEPGSVLILEGVFTLQVPAVTAGTLIYLHTSFAEARRRIIARDVAKNRSRDEVERRIDRRYFPSQKRYHRERAPRDHAHLVIDNENPARPRAVAGEVGHLPPGLRPAIDALLGSATATGGDD